MKTIRVFLSRLCALFSQSKANSELDEELETHLALLTERFVEQGMPPNEAAAAARRQFGNSTLLQQRHREARSFMFFSNLWRDLCFSARLLRKSSGFTAVALLTLALGIGLNIAIFSVLDAVMFKTLPVTQPDHLVQLRRNNGNISDVSFTYALWKQVQAQQDVFSGVFAYQGRLFNTAQGGEKHFAEGLYVSGGYFSTLGVPALLGRTLTDEDDRRGAAPVAVISYAYWKRQLGGGPDVLKREITLEKHRFQIVGVMPRWFYGMEPGDQFDVAVPLEAERIIDPDHSILDRPMAWWLYAFGRLKPGTSVESARARMRGLSPYINGAALPASADTDTRDSYMVPIDLVPAATGVSALRENYGKALILLYAMLGIVLLIACANVANLQLVRFSARRREFAIRAALGAARGRLFRQLATENLMLAAAGAGLGLLLARYASRLLLMLTSSRRQPTVLDLSIDYRLVLLVIGLTVATALFFGTAPALKLAHVAPQNAMKQEAQAVTGRGRREWMRFLIPLQVGLSLVLLFGATLFVRSLDGLLNQKLGFNKNSVLLINTDLDIHKGTDQQRQQIASALQERLATLPGVLSASRSAVTPIGGDSWQWDVEPQTGSGGAGTIHVFGNLISPGFFQTLGTPLLAGRDFDAHDTADAPLVALVNQTAAASLFPGVNPVGRFYHKVNSNKNNPLIQIVGVVGDAKYRRLRDAAPPTIYIPITQNTSPVPVIGTFEIHFAGATAPMEKQVEQLVQSIDPQISLEVTPLSVQVSDSLRQVQMIAALAAGFGVLAVVLACIGMYGVLAYSVSRRTAEIGVRIALGARRSSVLWMVIRDSLKLVGVGVALGVPAALMGARLVRGMLFGVPPTDAVSLLAAALVIGTTAALAAYYPAARASHIDPANALRYE
jgi:predicted permease